MNVVDNTDADTVPVTLKSPVTKELPVIVAPPAATVNCWSTSKGAPLTWTPPINGCKTILLFKL